MSCKKSCGKSSCPECNEAGPRGFRGPTGGTGPSGPSGPTGPTGPCCTGPTGGTGGTGPTGPAGTGITGPTGIGTSNLIQSLFDRTAGVSIPPGTSNAPIATIVLPVGVSAASFLEILATASVNVNNTLLGVTNDVIFQVTVNGNPLDIRLGPGVGFTLTTPGTAGGAHQVTRDSGGVVFRGTGFVAGDIIRLSVTTPAGNTDDVLIQLPSDNGSLYIQEMAV